MNNINIERGRYKDLEAFVGKRLKVEYNGWQVSSVKCESKCPGLQMLHIFNGYLVMTSYTCTMCNTRQTDHQLLKFIPKCCFHVSLL